MSAFLDTVECGCPFVGVAPTVFSVRTSAKIWHPDVGFIATTSDMDSCTWGILSFMERVLMLVMCVFARIQLHQSLGHRSTSTVGSDLNAATEHLARCVTGTIIFTTCKHALILSSSRLPQSRRGRLHGLASVGPPRQTRG